MKRKIIQKLKKKIDQLLKNKFFFFIINKWRYDGKDNKL